MKHFVKQNPKTYVDPKTNPNCQPIDYNGEKYEYYNFLSEEKRSEFPIETYEYYCRMAEFMERETYQNTQEEMKMITESTYIPYYCDEDGTCFNWFLKQFSVYPKDIINMIQILPPAFFEGLYLKCKPWHENSLKFWNLKEISRNYAIFEAQKKTMKPSLKGNFINV